MELPEYAHDFSPVFLTYRYPKTLESYLTMCNAFKSLDRKHGTPANSPLHHDSRCGLCSS